MVVLGFELCLSDSKASLFPNILLLLLSDRCPTSVFPSLLYCLDQCNRKLKLELQYELKALAPSHRYLKGSLLCSFR